MNKIERNAVICMLYKAGQTEDQIGKSFNLSKMRISQILRSSGLTRRDRRQDGRRQEFLGINLSAKTKAALMEESIKRNVSMSSLASEVISDVLTECGYKV